jgi:hypothetical protein
MEVILSKKCKSLTGSLGRIYGYSITRRNGKFVSIRNPKGPRIRDGHLRFIFACAELARDGFLIADIDIRGEELLQAAREADVEMETILPDVQYNAHDIRRIKTYYEL